MTNNQDTWPAGATWVFQGTVAEDGTGGTHICSLTITPGAGNEMELIAYRIQVGNTATAQGPYVRVDDGTNIIYELLNPLTATDTVANERYQGPTVQAGTLAGVKDNLPPSWRVIVSGSMRLFLSVSTAAISVTQTFAVQCRIKGAMPTAVLADSVGTPVLTVNTNKVF